MFWARTDAFASPYCLAVSGMPAPDPSVLGIDGPPDLAPPQLEALPALEARLAELFGTRAERVLATGGASSAMHLAAMHWLRGAHVVTELPSYEAFRSHRRGLRGLDVAPGAAPRGPLPPARGGRRRRPFGGGRAGPPGPPPALQSAQPHGSGDAAGGGP